MERKEFYRKMEGYIIISFKYGLIILGFFGGLLCIFNLSNAFFGTKTNLEFIFTIIAIIFYIDGLIVLTLIVLLLIIHLKEEE